MGSKSSAYEITIDYHSLRALIDEVCSANVNYEWLAAQATLASGMVLQLHSLVTLPKDWVVCPGGAAVATQ